MLCRLLVSLILVSHHHHLFIYLFTHLSRTFISGDHSATATILSVSRRSRRGSGFTVSAVELFGFVKYKTPERFKLF